MKPPVAQDDPDVQVRMLIDVVAGFHNMDGVQRGDVVTLPESHALRYEYFGYCEPVDAADETPQQRKARADRTAERVKAWLAAKNAEIERSRLEARHRPSTATAAPR